MSFWWDLAQDRRIQDAGAKAAGARSQAQIAQEQVEYLEHRVESLQLVTAAKWTLLRDRLGVSDAELVERMRQIDVLDGKTDGKMSVRVVQCGQCHRTMSTRFRRCVYCSAPVAGDSPFPGA